MNKVKITCKVCGKEKWVYIGHADQKFCSRECVNKGRDLFKEDFDHSLEWKRASSERWVCPYVGNVSCYKRTCNRCGWNPEVAKARTEEFMETGEVHVD